LFSFNFEEQTNILQADFSRASSPNVILSKPKQFQSCLTNFTSTLEELTFVPTQYSLKIKSYIDPQVINKPQVIVKEQLNALVYTEYKMDANEFQTYQVNKINI
jgi:hypothetical protein